MRARFLAPALVAGVILGAGVGHAKIPDGPVITRNVQGPEDFPPCPTEDSSGPCFWDAKTQGNGKGRSFWVLADGTVAHVTDQATAYDMYLLAYGEGNGCEADFDANYQGTRFVSDLPEKLQQELAEGRMSLDADGFQESPMMADYQDGSVIEVLGDGRITQVIVVGAYDGRCER